MITEVSLSSSELNSIVHKTAASRRQERRKAKPPERRKISGRKLSHQHSIDNDIVTAGQDLREKILEGGNIIKTSKFMDTEYELAFKGEELLHWMVSHCWAAHVTEAMSIAQLLLTHNSFANVSDTSNLMTFKKFAIYRFREDQETLKVPDSPITLNLDELYRRMWSGWVIRSRVIGWWVYTNTVTGEELITWLCQTAKLLPCRDEAIHFATQLYLVNFLIRVYPPVLSNEKQREFTDDDTVYQVNVCFNETVDKVTKVSHSLAHAVRLCSTSTESCMFYGKTEVADDMSLDNFELVDEAANVSLLSEHTEGDEGEDRDEVYSSKKFLQAVCRAYYPDFTTAIDDTYYSYNDEATDISIPDEIFHSFHLSTFENEDSIIIDFEQGLDLEEMKPRACTMDLMPTPRDSKLSFETAKLRLRDINEEEGEQRNSFFSFK